MLTPKKAEATMLSSTEQIQCVTDRRRFLLGGGFVLAFGLPMLREQATAAQSVASVGDVSEALISGRGYAGFMPSAFIRIGAGNEIVFFVPNVEFGQGIYSSQATLIAEELEVDLQSVRILPMPPNSDLFAQPLLQPQTTGGSNSIRRNWTGLRTAGATARTLLIEAAARNWGVSAQQCRAERGEVIGPSGEKQTYGALAAQAAQLPKPDKVELKDFSQFRLLGKSLPRTDTPDKVNGTARYGIDIVVPGMKVAAVMGCPVFGGRLRDVDDSDARAIAGVIQIVKLPDAVAVVGEHYWAANEGLRKLKITWDAGVNATVTTESLRAQITERSRSGEAGVAVSVGDAAASIDKAPASSRFEATYTQPFLAHGSMEPQAAIVHYEGSSAQIWCGTQIPQRAQALAAEAMGLAPAKVTIHPQLIGSAFGRKLEADYVAQAAAIARQCSFPVKMVWSREQDTRHDMYRSMYVDRIRASVDASGHPVAWYHRIAGASIQARLSADGVLRGGVDRDAVAESADPVYGQFPAMQVEFAEWKPPAGLNVSWWRGVGATRSVFVVESFVDELAHAQGKDSYEYRSSLLQNQPRARAVLDAAARAAQWGQSLPPRCGRGIVIQKSFESFLALVVEVGVSEFGQVTLRRITAAVDCGLTVNPNVVKQQIEGGVLYGLNAALFNEITFAGGAVQQSNFHNYRPIRINEVPPIEVIHLPSQYPSGGIGEAGTTAAAPALTNAIFAAVGVRLRELPVRQVRL
jgi:isoquinoline 1-oxidoreductase beta subunit